jgi:alginate O-acetyltransferase complex protein AlgI
VVFSSVSFLFFFLPIFLVLYCLAVLPAIRKKGYTSWTFTNLLLLITSILFYTWGEGLLVTIMLGSTAIDYLCGLLMAGSVGKGWRRPIKALEQGAQRTRTQKLALVLSLSANLGFLCLFKYFDFFVDNAHAIMGSLGLRNGPIEDVVKLALPMGISFYTFQSMSYTIDVYRGQIKATRNFIDFSCFVTMFPQLIAGPIVRYKEIADQLVRRTLSLEKFSYGARRFIIGLGKKVLIADVLAVTADRIYALPADQVTCGLAWLGTICFTLQLYFDFSGYSDMAIGLGRMLGFKFPENFNYPFISRSIREYWSRWHITLGTWFRDYLFYPLGGSRVSVPRLYMNLFTVFFLCGLWHGASWTYILWGLFHGFFLVLERVGFGKVLDRLPRPLAHLYLCLVNVGSKVLFRAATLAQAGAFFKAMAGFGAGDGRVQNVWLYLNPETSLALVIAVIGSMPVLPWLNRRLEGWIARQRGMLSLGCDSALASIKLAAVFAVFALSILWVANVTYSPFIYFRF